jgi:hypothetical protein
MKKPFALAAGLVSLAICAMLLMRLNAASLDVPFESDTIVLPLVVSGSAQYEIELQREAAGSYRVVRSTKVPYSTEGPVAVLKHGVLRVPMFKVGQLAYKLELHATDADSKTFALDSAKVITAPQGYAMLPDGRGGFYYEAAVIPENRSIRRRRAEVAFDKARSLVAFQETLYPYLKSNVCANCHSSRNQDGSGGQAPMHTDWDPAVAHEYALTRVNFADPANSKFVVRMRIDRHNCPKPDCASAATAMLEAINAWKSRIADMLPETPRLVPAGVAVPESDVVQWIASDRAKLAAADRDFIMYTSMHELHNEGLTAEELDIVRVGLGKALNSVARGAALQVRDSRLLGLEQGCDTPAVRRLGRRPRVRQEQARLSRQSGGFVCAARTLQLRERDFLGPRIFQNHLGAGAARQRGRSRDNRNHPAVHQWLSWQAQPKRRGRLHRTAGLRMGGDLSADLYAHAARRL